MYRPKDEVSLGGVLADLYGIEYKSMAADYEQYKRYGVCDKYFSLKDDVKKVETLRRGAEKAMGETTPLRTKERSYRLEL